MKRIIIMVVVFLIVCFASPVSANDSTVQMFYENQRIQFDVQPTEIDGTVMIPLRALFEAMSKSFTWHEESQSVTWGYPLKTFKVGVPAVQKIGYADIQLEKAPLVINGRMLIPLSCIDEVLWTNTTYDKEKNTVHIEDRMQGNLYTDLAGDLSFQTVTDWWDHSIFHSKDENGTLKVMLVNYGKIDYFLPYRELEPTIHEVFKYDNPIEMISPENALQDSILNNQGNSEEYYAVNFFDPIEVPPAFVITDRYEEEGIYFGYIEFNYEGFDRRYEVYVRIKTEDNCTYKSIIYLDTTRTPYDEELIMACLRNLGPVEKNL